MASPNGPPVFTSTKAANAPTIKVLLLGDSGVGKSSLMMRFTANLFSVDSNPTIGIDFRVKQIDLADEDDGVDLVARPPQEGSSLPPSAAGESSSSLAPGQLSNSTASSQPALRNPVNVQIWDTAGQERFRTLTASYYRGAHAMIFVFDVTRPSTLASVRTWLDEAKLYCGSTTDTSGGPVGESSGPIMALVANKVDCYEGPSPAHGGGGSGRTVAADGGGGDAAPLTAEENHRLKLEAEAFARENKMLYMRCSAKTKEGVAHLFESVARKVVKRPQFVGLYGGRKPTVGGARAANLSQPKPHADGEPDERGLCLC